MTPRRTFIALLVVLAFAAGAYAQPARGPVLTYLDSPEQLSLAEFARGRHNLLLMVAIVNPFGPTAYGLDVLQRPGRSGPELVSFSLNPFSVDIQLHARVVGTASRAQMADAVLGSGRDFSILDIGPPTLVFPTAIDDPFVRVLHRNLAVPSDGFVSLDRLRRFPLRSFDRISEEVEDGLSAALKKPRTSRAAQRRLTAAELKEYADILLAPAHMRDELGSFAKAWTGAIEFQQSGRTGLPVALPWETLVPLVTAMTSPGATQR